MNIFANAFILLFLICVTFSGRLVACDEGNNEKEAFDLDEIVVTATKSKKKVADVTSSVSVIDTEEIEASNDNYVMDIIGKLPGVFVQKDNIYGRQGIQIRGLGSNCRRLQTLIDGRPEKMGIFGCTITQTLPLSNVERIEIIRGPESALYGSDAMGGVVNIITKRMREDGYETDGILSFGGYDIYHGQLNHGGKKGDFDYYFTFDQKYMDGHRANSRYKGYNVTGRMGYQLNEVYRLEFSSKHFDDEAYDPGPDSAPFTHDDRKEYNRSSFDLDLTAAWEKVDASIKLFQSRGHHRFTMPTIQDYWHSRDRITGALSKASIDVFGNGDIEDNLLIGYDWYREFGKTQEPWNSSVPTPPYHPGHWHRTNHEMYLFNELLFGNMINTVGGRLHYDQVADWEFMPHWGMLWHISSDTRLRGKICKGFRTPKFNELYLFPPATEDLDPEKVWSYEIGIDQNVTNRLRLEVNFFYMDVDNFIQRRFNSSPPPRYLFLNTGSFVIKGIETGFNLRLLSNLDITFYHTFMNVGNSRDDKISIPNHKLDTLIDYRWRDFSISFGCEYVAGLYEENETTGAVENVDDYVVANLKASYWLNSEWQAFLGIDNIFNSNYEMYPEYPMPGTTVISGLRFQF